MVLHFVGEYVTAFFRKASSKDGAFCFYKDFEGKLKLAYLKPTGLPPLNLKSIPNREVKPACADGTAFCGRVCHCLSFRKPFTNVRGFLHFRAMQSRFGSCRRLSLEKPSVKTRGFLFLNHKRTEVRIPHCHWQCSS